MNGRAENSDKHCYWVPHNSDALEQLEINDQNLQQEGAVAYAVDLNPEHEPTRQLYTGLAVRAAVHLQDNSTLLVSGICEQYANPPFYELFYEFSGTRSTDPGFQLPQEFFGGIRIFNSYDVYLTEFLSACFLDRSADQFLSVNDVNVICDVNSSTYFVSVIILGARDDENNSDHGSDGNSASDDETDSGNNGTDGIDEDDNTDHENNGADDHISDSEI
ncbi:unnamed protein product [Gongylonema pulchrum]|uniref:CPSF_A domain-containing protein n=1 Tax=Gongylonema pulchrum TaxID=637853 RepID=A0A183D8G4_9BILA|nr:unnamed protein product [Gongylonema pulchrum]